MELGPLTGRFMTLPGRMRIVFGVTVAAAAAIACRDESRSAVRTVTDSAGIQLITIPAPDSSVPRLVILTDDPVFVVGGQADSSGQFNSIGSAVVLPEGRVAVATNDVFRVHVFDSLGRQIVRFGRKGDGPGEFARPPVLYMHADSLIALQVRSGGRINLSVWNFRGEIIREYEARIRVDFDAGYGPIGVASNGDVFMMTAMTGLPASAGGGPHRAKVTISRVSRSGGDAVAILDLPGEDRYGLNGANGLRDTYVKFGKTTVATISGGVLQSGTNDGFAIDSWTPDGHLRRRLRIAIEPQRVTTAMRERSAQELLSDTQPETRRLSQLAASVIRYADHLRSYDALYATQEGGLWIAMSRMRDEETRKFLIIDADGQLIGSAALPAEFKPVWISRNRILLRGLDKDDVPYLGLYRITW